MTLEERAAAVQERSQAAYNAGEMTKEFCASKAAVLEMVHDGKADAMSVSQPPVFPFDDGLPHLVHYAVRFNDRVLGEEVRAITMEGFGLT